MLTRPSRDMTVIAAARLAHDLGGRLVYRNWQLLIQYGHPERHGTLNRNPMPRSWRSRPAPAPITPTDWLIALSRAGLTNEK